MDELKEFEQNIRAKDEFFIALTNTEMKNVMELKIAHEIYKILETLYEGDSYVNIAKLQSLKIKYEMLKMGKN